MEAKWIILDVKVNWKIYSFPDLLFSSLDSVQVNYIPLFVKICSLVKQYATINAIPLCLVDNVFFAMDKMKGLCFAHGRQG